MRRDLAVGQAAPPVLSVVLSVVASSHHWIMMGILLLLGGGMESMGATMLGVVWLRRSMILATLALVGFSAFKIARNRRLHRGLVALNAATSLISLGLIAYTVSQFGW